jgi:EAL and modified HD-GYP domain-containing signal transduction protein
LSGAKSSLARLAAGDAPADTDDTIDAVSDRAGERFLARRNPGTDGESMDLYLARQPVLDKEQRTVAYELLFRSGAANAFTERDPDRATGQLLHDALLEFGLNSLVGPRKAFINITRQTLVNELYSVLPPDQVVLELLETVSPTWDVIEACRKLKKNGYSLALDDVTAYAREMDPLLELADLVKIDVLATEPEQLAQLVRQLSPFRVRLLAEKVESAAMFRRTADLGFELFQGYFFEKPEVVTSAGIPRFKLNYVQFLQEISRPDLDYAKLEAVIKREVSLSIKLLRFLNSAAFGSRSEITSIKHSLVLLGERAIRRWASVVALLDLGDDRPAEVVVTGLVRARFCEALGARVGLADRELSLFLLGILSVGEALLGHPVHEIVKEISIVPDVKAALLDEDNELSRILRFVLAFERASWDDVSMMLEAMPQLRPHIADAYRDALRWADDAFLAPV